MESKENVGVNHLGPDEHQDSGKDPNQNIPKSKSAKPNRSQWPALNPEHIKKQDRYG
jgi:hypothetical protein